jgi:hypothetical protein
MTNQASYSYLFSENESRLGEIGIKIIDYENLIRFINDSPIVKPKPHIKKEKRYEQGQSIIEYYLHGLSSEVETLPGPVAFVIEGLSYSKNKYEFLEFWSKFSTFTEPFSFKCSDRSEIDDGYEYVVFCNNSHLYIDRLRKRDRYDAERVEEYISD